MTNTNLVLQTSAPDFASPESDGYLIVWWLLAWHWRRALATNFDSRWRLGLIKAIVLLARLTLTIVRWDQQVSTASVKNDGETLLRTTNI
jgi:hypothetical protein